MPPRLGALVAQATRSTYYHYYYFGKENAGFFQRLDLSDVITTELETCRSEEVLGLGSPKPQALKFPGISPGVVGYSFPGMYRNLETLEDIKFWPKNLLSNVEKTLEYGLNQEDVNCVLCRSEK